MTAAEELREAARLMRERAEAAALAVGNENWHWDLGWVERQDITRTVSHPVAEALTKVVVEHLSPLGRPVVAVAVADWLEQHTEQHESAGRNECRYYDDSCGAVIAARAYLGRES